MNQPSKLQYLVGHPFRFIACAALFLSAAAALISGVGCDRGESPVANPATNPTTGPTGAKAYKLAFVTNNVSDFWKIASTGVHKYEKQANVQVDIKMPSNGKTPEEQNQILETLLSQGYDAIAVSAISPKDQLPILSKVAQQSKLITFDSDAPDAQRMLYVGSLNYEAGKTLGQQIVKLLPSGGKIAVFVGKFSADNAAQRLKGIEDTIAGHNIEIAQKREDGTDKNNARRNVEDVLNSGEDIKLLCGLWSYNGSAIADAINGSGKKGQIKAAVFDEQEQTLRGIESGTIDCTVVQHPYEMGYRSAHWLDRLTSDTDKAKAEIPADKVDNTGTEVIDKSNVADFRQRLADWLK